jgi:hypothetical protein
MTAVNNNMKSLPPTLVKVVSLLMLSALVSATYAFDIWGFHSGMTRREADEAARHLGLTPAPFGQDSIRYKGPLDRYGYTTSFCDGRLMMLGREYRGSASTLFDVLAEVGAHHTDPVVTLDTLMESSGQLRTIKYTYQGSELNDKTDVNVITQTGSEEFSIVVLHKDFKMKCSKY